MKTESWYINVAIFLINVTTINLTKTNELTDKIFLLRICDNIYRWM